MLRDWTRLLRALVLAGAVGLAAWWTLLLQGRLRERERELADREARIESLEQELSAAAARIQELELALRLLKVDHRVARIEVLDQRPSAERPGEVETTLRFQEIAPDGRPLGAGSTLTVLGRVAYVDALVVKFDDAHVEAGDALRGTSVCLFRRLFGEHQEPSLGFPLDPVGVRPIPYGSPEDGVSALEVDLWRRFWDYANDPVLARQAGVRAAHGEAPYMELRPGGRYLVELRASGGLSIRAE